MLLWFKKEEWKGCILSFRWTCFLLAIAAAILTSCAAAWQQQDFNKWLMQFRKEALSQGISEHTLNSALIGLSPIPRVLELDRNQPEQNKTFEAYINEALSAQRVHEGRFLRIQYARILQDISQKYGVSPSIIIALWGMETNFGSNTGGFYTIPALATLAYDGRRNSFFRQELIYALRILDEGHISLKDMTGSWAGALGQNQFMPSTFLSYAVDYDHDGRRDIWHTPADIFASTANYLAKAGWIRGQSWGLEVRSANTSIEDLKESRKTLTEWKRLGFYKVDGNPLSESSRLATLIIPEGAKGRSFLVFSNYNALMSWNKSIYFATAVGLLADQVDKVSLDKTTLVYED